MHTHNKRLFICTYARRRPTIHLQRAYHYMQYRSRCAPHIMQLGAITTTALRLWTPHIIQVDAPHNTQGVLINNSASHNTTACRPRRTHRTPLPPPPPLPALLPPRSSRPTCRGCRHTIAECDNNRRDSVCRRDSASPQLLCPTPRPHALPTPPATPHSRSSGARGRCQRAEDRTQRGERRAPRKKQGRPPHAKYHALGPLPGFH